MPKQKTELIITEKPAAAAKIAAALGKAEKKNLYGVPYYEIKTADKTIIIGCAVGHLFTLKQMSGKGWPVFDIGWVPNSEVRKQDWSKKYYSALVSLCKKADTFVIACDYDIEGEVIGWNVLRFICKKENAKRMKFSTLTASELKQAYQNLMKDIDFGQAYAGETRHKLDWMYGINLSRALMEAIKKAGSFRILSIGRVQGPALHLIVEKEKSIQSFKPEPYWQVYLLVKNTHQVEVRYPKDITKKTDLAKFKILKGKQAQASTSITEQKIPPPAPFDLTTLQTEAYKFYSFSPSRTLQIAQQLYLAGLISYPRTSSQKLPASIAYKDILKKLPKSLTKYAKRSKPVEGKKSDPAHPSIYPTGEKKELSQEEKKLYDLIVRRFISCFCQDAVLENKKIEVTIDSLKFIAKGLHVKEKGWMNVYKAKLEEKTLPDLNGKVYIKEIRIEEKQTQPPKRFTSASLVRELEKRNLGTKCLTGDTKIISDNQEIQIQDLFKNSQKYKKEKDIEIKKLKDIKTTSLNKNNPLITFPKLISRRKVEKNEKIIKIETDSSAIKLTGKHLVYIYKNNKIEQTSAENLQISDKLLGIIKKYEEGNVIIKRSVFNNKYRLNRGEIKHKFASKTNKGILISKFPIRWSTSLAWLLGYYYGDGSYDGPEYNGSHSISFSTTEKKAVNLLKENINNIFGREPYAYNLGTKYKIDCNSVMSCILIKTFPKLNGKNPINIPKKFIGDFLRGFFDADGNVHLRHLGRTMIKGVKCNSFDTPRVKFTLANEKLIVWVRDLLKEIGIQTKINKGIAKCNGKKFDCYTILISGRDKIEKFAYLVGFDSYKENILYKGLKCESLKYQVLKNSAKIYFALYNKELKIEDLLEKTNLSRYKIITALKRLHKLGIISKKRYTNRNKHIYSLIKKDFDYLNHLIKINCEKVKRGIFLIPIRDLSMIKNYKGYVYDLSVEKNSPNFITEGNILVHNSTRASIIETLFNRGYVKGKSIEATPLGISLINSLEKNSPVIIDEKLTREFEKQMTSIQTSKKELKEKSEKIIEEAKETLLKIEKQFRKNEGKIGKELVKANNHIREKEREENTLTECPKCKKGNLRILYNRKSRRYFIACSAYPKCKNTYTLPPNGLMKPSLDKEGNNEKCPECNFPLMIAIRKGKRPWKFCFNPECPTRKQN